MYQENDYVILRSRANKNLYPNNTFYDFTNQLCTSVAFKNKTSVALAELHLPLSYKKLQPTQPDVNTMLIFCDIVDDTIVGETRLNLLKVITVDLTKIHVNAELFSFPILFYMPLTTNSANNIRIRFEDNQGNILQPDKSSFTDQDETFVVLHFK
jgi:hypothetical protein